MKTLKDRAILKGLCLPYQNDWQDDNDLVSRYIRGVTWCMNHQFPSLEEMAEYDSELVENDVYNNKNVSHILSGDTYIYNNCRGEIEIIDYSVSRAYIALDSLLKITAKGNSILYLDIFDNANIQLVVEDSAYVSVNQYGNSSIQVIKGNAKIEDRR